jgi:hypothetical protein
MEAVHPRERDQFLRDVVAELSMYQEIGAGVVQSKPARR